MFILQLDFVALTVHIAALHCSYFCIWMQCSSVQCNAVHNLSSNQITFLIEWENVRWHILIGTSAYKVLYTILSPSFFIFSFAFVFVFAASFLFVWFPSAFYRKAHYSDLFLVVIIWGENKRQTNGKLLLELHTLAIWMEVRALTCMSLPLRIDIVYAFFIIDRHLQRYAIWI